jgi:dienelactone hydrolase
MARSRRALRLAADDVTWGVALCLALALHVAAPAQTNDLPVGRIVDDVRCLADASQGYALYLPSNMTRDRTWSVVIGLHPGARGRAMVEKFQAGAERYGYILAGSNNSRNGPMQPSIDSVAAMAADLSRRFPIDLTRVYLAGMSGGARVALHVAIGSGKIAGVIASSAGYADSVPRRTVPFPIFATAGTEDFNNLELRRLDRALTTPHRLVVFDGGHTLPPDAVALQALEWLEAQAMHDGRRTRDPALIAQFVAKGRADADAATEPLERARRLDALARSLEGMTDVSAIAAEAAALFARKVVKTAIRKEEDDVAEEQRAIDDVAQLERRLTAFDARGESLAELDRLLSSLSRDANGAKDTIERRRARRLLRTIASGAGERTRDADYLKLIEKYRFGGAPR